MPDPREKSTGTSHDRCEPRMQAKEVATEALNRFREFNRRTLDGLAARLYFYFSWAHECTGTLSEIRRCAHGAPPVHASSRRYPVGDSSK